MEAEVRLNELVGRHGFRHLTDCPDGRGGLHGDVAPTVDEEVYDLELKRNTDDVQVPDVSAREPRNLRWLVRFAPEQAVVDQHRDGTLRGGTGHMPPLGRLV